VTATAQLLLLDFDGVIADSVDECRAVTWYAGEQVDDQPLPDLLAQVPGWFTTRFDTLRPYSRTLDDFFVAKPGPRDVPITTQAMFDALKAQIASAAINEFATAATALRLRWRREQRPHWLAAHTIFDGVRELLERRSGAVFVITAKDAESSMEILTHFGLGGHIAGIIGEVSDKALAARCICLGRGVTPEQALFVDDNLTNVARVHAAGVPARWATWGWTTPEHASRAAGLQLAPITLDQLVDV